MRGRGAGDMKGGFAMGLLAVAALCRAMPGVISGELGFLSVIEEECTGNGTLAACHAGVLGDAAVLLEPTGLGLLLGGVGVLWVEIEIDGIGAHAEAADRAVNPVRCVPVILQALAGLEEEINTGGRDPAFSGIARPYNVNVGVLTAGDWASSVPARARLRVRVGFPRGWTADEAFGRVEAATGRAAAGDAWLAAHPPRLHQTGFRAEGYLLARRPPAGERDGGRARPRSRRPARADDDGQHHRRQVLPQPVRACPLWPTARSRATSTPPTRRSSWPASCAGRRPWRGSSPPSSRTEPGMAEPVAGEPFGALLAPITLRTAGERIAERLVTAIALG